MSVVNFQKKPQKAVRQMKTQNEGETPMDHLPEHKRQEIQAAKDKAHFEAKSRL